MMMICGVSEVMGAITPTKPAKGDGSAVSPYQISTAAELWGFAAIVNGTNGFTQNLSACAVLTDDIDMGGEANGSFPGIAPHSGSGDVYKGTFNGQGHKITDFYMSTTSNRSGLFSATNNATIKNFSISGKFIVSSNHTMCGVIVGDIDPAGATTLLEDIDCDVTVTCNNASASRIGGIAGCVTRPGSIINRCRYHGTITGNGVTEGIGGIAGDVRGGTIKNSLFDGTITTTASAPKIGGIFGKRGENLYGKMVIQDCLVIGDNIPNTGSYCGAIIGYHTSTGTNTNTIKNCYYTTNNSLNPVASGASYITFDPSTNPVNVTGSENLTNGTLKANLNNGDNNWKQRTNYPIPGVESTYAITFDSDGGSAVASITTTAGASVSAPTSPTKTGYDFAGWVDGDGKDVTFPYTMPAANVTLKATWTLATFHVNYYVDNALYQSVPVKYTEAITPLDAPTKERYTFSGWSTIPANMPANDVRVDGTFTYTANAQGVYEIGTKEDFFNFATVASSNVSANAKLLEDINIEEETFNGFTGYKGTFDGNKKTISGYKRTFSDGGSSLGFFNTTTGATIKDFTLVGEWTYDINKACYAIGGVIGMANSTTIEGVTSKVNMTFGANCPTGASGIRCVGGIAGRINGGTINKCRYNGTIDLSANSGICDRFGGIVGDLGSASTISNCLFDGEIKVAATSSLAMGGILGTKNNQTPTISHCLFNGKMTFPAGANISNCGPISGGTGVTASDSYYDMTGFTVGGVKQAKTAVQQSSSIERTSEEWSNIKIALGETNWILDSNGNPIPGEGGAHVHSYTNGFCLCGGYEPAEPTAEVYQITNAGKLFWFAQQISNGGISASSNAELTKSINLGNVEFPGIGAYAANASTAYSGIFDGQGNTISGYNRKVTSGNQQGFFNYAKGATIKNLKLEGTMTDNSTGQQHGSVIGWADEGTLIEDVHSSVNVTITSTAAQVGGFVGRAGGTFNRCSYRGKVSTSTAYDKIGGFAGTLREGTIKNCLFDGQLQISTDKTELKAGGFAGAVIEKEASLSNSLVNGTIDISYKTENCGIIIGYADKNVAFTNALYTTTEATKQWNAIGAVSNANVTGTAKDVTSESWDNVNIMLNPTEGTVGNWQIITGKDYPQPKAGEWAHKHTYKNGFCIADDGNYEAAEKDNLDGYYKVTNAGNLWWLMEQINSTDAGTLAKDVKIKLTKDIDMESESHGSCPGFCPLGSYTEDGKQVDDWTTAFQGVFDGKGYTINNYYRLHDVSGIRRGLINSAKDATIRHFNINGNVKITTTGAELALSGVVIGSASGTTKIEDIHSSVNVTSPAALIRGYGGVAGALEDKMNTASVTMNRCRYSGTMTLNGEKTNQNIGGVVGELRSAVMKNCLFDGTITVASTVPYTFVGGLVGKVGTSDNSEIHRSLVHGTITLNGYSELTAEQKTAKNCGIVIGGADHTIYMNKVFHTTTNVTSGLGIIGAHTTTKTVTNENDGIVGTTITVDLLLGTSTNKTESLADLYSETFRTTLGEPNWAEVEKTEGKYTYPLKDEGHIHKYRNGFCTSGDGEYQSANETNNTYQINNGGKLYWFAEQFNAGKIPQDATVEIMNNIDMEGTDYIYPGIGTSDCKFKGTFNGHGYRITNYHRDIINSECTGLINYATGATIKSFILSGTTNFNLATTKSFHGTVLGMGVNDADNGNEMLIEDVTSAVYVNAENQFVRVWGGIAGRSSGRMNRCRFSGAFGNITSTTVAGATTTTVGKSHSGEQIGGICANAKEAIIIENCLFDGKLASDCTVPKMRVSGILSSNEKGTGAIITIKNCLFNGCLELSHSYTDPAGVKEDKDANGNYTDPLKKATENGIIAGYLDSNKPSVINNIYYLNSCDGMDGIPLGDFNKNPNSTSSDAGTTLDKQNVVTKITGTPTNEQWNEIFKKLDEYKEVKDAEGNVISFTRNNNWIYDANAAGTGTHEAIPVPSGKACTHEYEDGKTAFNEFGWCQICGERRKLVIDEKGRYQMTYVSDLATFRDMVNSASDDSEIKEFNAVLTQNIDFADFPGELGDPIGNDYYNRYLYNFDGNGYTIKNIRVTANKNLIGMFGFAGNKDHDCKIHDFTITGIIDVPYSSEDHDEEPLCIGVVGKMYRGEIYNVHSQLTIKNTKETKAYVGGILGSAETEEVGQDYGVTISKCSYSGVCEVNAYGDMGGIVGRVSRNTLIRDCTFAGSMNHTYTGEANQTLFGGVVGYNESADFKGIKNCVIAGMMKTGKTASGADRKFVAYGTEGNHKNSLCGEDKVITNGASDEYKQRYSNNYALNVYKPLISANSVVEATYTTQEQFASGEICAVLNAIDSNPSYDPFEAISTENAVGYPWGQILGYQVGDLTKGELIGNYTDGSPAQRVPFPGYQNPEKKTYKVVKDGTAYTADWYYFDDAGDTTPMPSDAASMKVKKVEYTRKASYIKGYCSVCLPFAFTSDMKPTTETILYTYDSVYEAKSKVTFKEMEEGKTIPAGTPFIMYVGEQSEADWNPAQELNQETDIALAAKNAKSVGLYGVFNTTKIGAGKYKVNSAGTSMSPTTEKGVCYPFRVYLTLPAQSESKTYSLNWEDGNSADIELINLDGTTTNLKYYNIQGQQVSDKSKGIVIVNGKKYIKK